MKKENRNFGFDDLFEDLQEYRQKVDTNKNLLREKVFVAMDAQCKNAFEDFKREFSKGYCSANFGTQKSGTHFLIPMFMEKEIHDVIGKAVLADWFWQWSQHIGLPYLSDYIRVSNEGAFYFKVSDSDREIDTQMRTFYERIFFGDLKSLLQWDRELAEAVQAQEEYCFLVLYDDVKAILTQMLIKMKLKKIAETLECGASCVLEFGPFPYSVKICDRVAVEICKNLHPLQAEYDVKLHEAGGYMFSFTIKVY